MSPHSIRSNLIFSQTNATSSISLCVQQKCCLSFICVCFVYRRGLPWSCCWGCWGYFPVFRPNPLWTISSSDLFSFPAVAVSSFIGTQPCVCVLYNEGFRSRGGVTLRLQTQPMEYLESLQVQFPDLAAEISALGELHTKRCVCRGECDFFSQPVFTKIRGNGNDSVSD